MLNSFLDSLGGLILEIGPLMIFGLAVAGLLHLLVTEEMVLRQLGRPGWRSVLRATSFAIPLPLCSCSVVPVAASLRRKGASSGSTVSFLIAAPQIGADSFLLTQGLLGPFFAVYRLLTSLVTALVAGLLLDWSRLELAPLPAAAPAAPGRRLVWWREFLQHVQELVGSLADNLLVGLVLATLILVLLPDGWLGSMQGLSPWVSMLVMLAVGLPLYVCATASTPIAAALVLKGLHPGAALIFLLAGPATNMVTMVMLKGSLGWRVLLIYLATIAGFALGAGWLLGIVQPDLAAGLSHVHQHGDPTAWYQWAGAGLLGLLLARHYLARLRRRLGSTGAAAAGTELDLTVRGMTCEHCAGRVEKAVLATGLVDILLLDVGQGRLRVRLRDSNTPDKVRARLAAVLAEAGYEVPATVAATDS